MILDSQVSTNGLWTITGRPKPDLNTIYFSSTATVLSDSFISTTMSSRDLQDEFEDQFNDVVTRLQSKNLFQSDWDIASFAVFFIFIGKKDQ